MARKRYQQGSLILRGTRVKKWYGRWLEDELQPDGSVIRIHRSEILGDKSEFPTKRLAQRELDRRLAAINSPIYKAKPTARFEDFAEKWKSKVSIHHEGSTQDSEKSEIIAWVAALGAIRLRDISTEVVQDVITLWSSPGKDKRSEKTIRNRVATLRLLRASAKAWGYVTHDVCDDLVLPTWNREEQPSFTVEQVKQIIDAAHEPYKTIFWLVAETGIRRGENLWPERRRCQLGRTGNHRAAQQVEKQAEAAEERQEAILRAFAAACRAPAVLRRGGIPTSHFS